MDDQPPLPPPAEAPGAESAYRVLARKYRPSTFSQLIGQEAMVRTLTNAIASGRLAHAFVLTGVRGVGKTTTARILARGLNCVGPDGSGGPTPDPCGVCAHCRDIAEDRHVDVMEMDAASRTGVDDIRELIEAVRYRPVSARYKIYIIDEVHMLSKNAFNALLKTLEEPPSHVKFVFATTESRKIPVTVLSRCQRFDLRRVDADTLMRHLGRIAEIEGASIAAGALALIARAAEGSVRDGLSLLDQAIALGEGEIDEERVRIMLGLADRTRLLDLFDHVMRGEAPPALALLGDMYESGAEPASVVQDLLELSHWITRLKLAPQAADSPIVSESERLRGVAAAERLSLGVLARAWQMLLKGLGEVQAAPAPLAAAEMVLIRLIYAADLPTPADLVGRLAGGGSESAAPAPGTGRGATAAAPRPSASARVSAPIEGGETPPVPDPPRAALVVGGAAEASARAEPRDFLQLVALFNEKREAILAAHLCNSVHLVRFEPGRLEFRPGEHAPGNLASRLGACLLEWTGRRWIVALSSDSGAPTLAEQQAASVARERAEAERHPLVQAVLSRFPGATIRSVRDLGIADAELPADEPPEGSMESAAEDVPELPGLVAYGEEEERA